MSEDATTGLSENSLDRVMSLSFSVATSTTIRENSSMKAILFGLNAPFLAARNASLSAQPLTTTAEKITSAVLSLFATIS